MFSLSHKGTTFNGTEEFLPTSSGVSTTVTQITKTSETITVNPVDETVPTSGEAVVTTTKEEITETTTMIENQPTATVNAENVPDENLTDGMDTTE